MDHPPPHDIASAVEASRAGDREASNRLVTLLYHELRRLAASLLQERRPGQTLQATALVHEAYLRIIGKDREEWAGRRHFFSTAARAMRDILVEESRRKASLKRGGKRARVALDGEALAIEPKPHIIEIDEALAKLEQADPRKGEIVQLRYFGGLSVPETAEVLGVSTATIEREWRFIRAWLGRELSGEPRREDEAP